MRPDRSDRVKRLSDRLLATDRSHRIRAIAGVIAAAGAIVVVASLAGCGLEDEQTPAGTPVEAPAVARLPIPDLLNPTYGREGIAHYDLKTGQSRHDYRQATPTDTYAYNGMPVLGPTLRLRTGDSVVINVANELDQVTTTHWHGAGQHVFHPHQTRFQILSINGEPPPPEESGWEDSVLVNGAREIVIAARFDTYASEDIPYLFHCHILDHEDLGMMGQFLVIGE